MPEPEFKVADYLHHDKEYKVFVKSNGADAFDVGRRLFVEEMIDPARASLMFPELSAGEKKACLIFFKAYIEQLRGKNYFDRKGECPNPPLPRTHPATH